MSKVLTDEELLYGAKVGNKLAMRQLFYRYEKLAKHLTNKKYFQFKDLGVEKEDIYPIVINSFYLTLNFFTENGHKRLYPYWLKTAERNIYYYLIADKLDKKESIVEMEVHQSIMTNKFAMRGGLARGENEKLTSKEMDEFFQTEMHYDMESTRIFMAYCRGFAVNELADIFMKKASYIRYLIRRYKYKASLYFN